MLGKRQSGIGLIEFAMVIALIGLASLIAVPAFSGWMPDFRLKKASRDLFSNFQRAKFEAAKSNCNCTVTFGQRIGSETYGYVLFQDADNDLEYDAGERVIAGVRWSDYKNVDLDTSMGGGTGLDFPTNDDGLPCVAFGANGLPRDNAGNAGTGRVFLVNTNTKKRNVEISPTGNIKVNMP